ncbi:MAG TPA: ABC transporter ATP-binding protein [Clostridiales bacterium]|jgi:peptide/nickel transport system ATP-binding protein|nr:ABC transporter ATP-binding protein [Clostridiales bacterium]
MNDNLIIIQNLKISFYHENGRIQVVRGFDLSMDNGEIIGILGESGSGKTVSATSILRLEDEADSIDSGTIFYKGKNLVELTEKEYRKIRGNQISYVFQNASNALNPYKKIGLQLTEVLRNHKLLYSRSIVVDVLKEVGIEEADTVFDMYPFQLSGGQNQRIMIAQGIISKPDLLIADEPSSSIDASLRKTVLDLLKNINQKSGMAIILITHDFDEAKYLCDRLIIMYGGLVMEEGFVSDIFENPLHPYTGELIKCASSLSRGDNPVYALEGTAPTPLQFTDECPFFARCKQRLPECILGIPEMIVMDNRKVRCIRYK